MAQTLNCNGEDCRKKYTVLQRDAEHVGHAVDKRDLLEGISSNPTDEGRRSEAIQRALLIIAVERKAR